MILLMLIAAIAVAIFLKNRKADDKFRAEEAFELKMTENDRKIQQRVVKEIENFLNYNGDEQDDIL